PLPPPSTPFPYTTLFRSCQQRIAGLARRRRHAGFRLCPTPALRPMLKVERLGEALDVPRLTRGFRTQAMINRDGNQPRSAFQAADRKSTRLNSSHVAISY